MRLSSVLLVIGILLPLWIGGLMSPAWTQQATSPSLKIGMVNMREVFTQYKKAKLFEDQLEKEKKAEEASIQELEKQMKSGMDQIDEIRKTNPDSELLKEKRENLVTMEALRRYRADSWNDRVKDIINKNTAAIYNDIRAVIDVYAQNNGYDLVMKIEDGKLEMDTDESSNQRIARRAVLYANSNFDVTNQIIAELERKN